MKVQNRADPSHQEFAVLAATWIMACNDENAVSVFEDIEYRLGLPKESA
jgi:hypothetical protein